MDGYENDHTVFSRTIPWERRASLVKQLKLKRTGGDGEVGTPESAKKKRKGATK